MRRLTLEEQSRIEDVTGLPRLTPELFDDHDWVYAELAREEAEADRTDPLPDDMVITVTPEFEFEWTGRLDRLLATLDEGKANQKELKRLILSGKL